MFSSQTALFRRFWIANASELCEGVVWWNEKYKMQDIAPFIIHTLEYFEGCYFRAFRMHISNVNHHIMVYLYAHCWKIQQRGICIKCIDNIKIKGLDNLLFQLWNILIFLNANNEYLFSHKIIFLNTFIRDFILSLEHKYYKISDS